MSKEIIDPGNKLPDTSDVLEKTSRTIGEVLVASAKASAPSLRREIVLRFGSILQQRRSLSFLDAFKIEFKSFRDSGRIKDDYVTSEQHQECMQELLDFLDSDAPDKLRFDILKKILLVTATEEHSSRDDVLPQQYMRLVRELSSGEALVLLTVYRLSKEHPGDSNDSSAAGWLKEIAGVSGLRHPELVAIHEEKLLTKNLLTPRRLSDQSGITRGKHDRLTEFGYQLCEFISEYPET